MLCHGICRFSVYVCIYLWQSKILECNTLFKCFFHELDFFFINLSLQKCIRFNPEASVWVAKQRILCTLNQSLKDVLNYGLFQPASNGRDGKFLDEERLLREYPQPVNKGVPSLEVFLDLISETFVFWYKLYNKLYLRFLHAPELHLGNSDQQVWTWTLAHRSAGVHLFGGAVPCVIPKRLQRISPSGRFDFGVFLCWGHRRCILFCDLIKKCKVLDEAFGSLIRFATVG